MVAFPQSKHSGTEEVIFNVPKSPRQTAITQFTISGSELQCKKAIFLLKPLQPVPFDVLTTCSKQMFLLYLYLSCHRDGNHQQTKRLKNIVNCSAEGGIDTIFKSRIVFQNYYFFFSKSILSDKPRDTKMLYKDCVFFLEQVTICLVLKRKTYNKNMV